MTAKRAPLPPAWYQTLSETATELGTHPDRLLYYCDSGLLLPAARIHKTLLPVQYPGPSPYLIVRLDGYREMLWTPVDGDMVAPLVGTHRAYQVDGHTYTNVDIEGAGILIRRSDLVLTSDQVEALQEARDVVKPPNQTKVRTLQRIVGALIADRWPNAGHYTVAEQLVRDFQLKGLSISKECAAAHVKECREELAAMLCRGEVSMRNDDELTQAA